MAPLSIPSSFEPSVATSLPSTVPDTVMFPVALNVSALQTTEEAETLLYPVKFNVPAPLAPLPLAPACIKSCPPEITALAFVVVSVSPSKS